MIGRFVLICLSVLTAAGAIVALAGCASSTSAPGPSPAASKPASTTIQLKVGYADATAAFAPLFSARDQGFFTQQGLDVALTRVAGPAQVPALMAGEINLGFTGANVVVHADLGGSSIVMVAATSNLPVLSLYSQPAYKSITDLSGQSIGITAVGTSTDAAARLFSSHYDMDKKVQIIPTGSTIPGILAAVTKGGVAAGIMSPPTTDAAARAGLVELVNGVQLGIPLNQGSLAVTRDYASQHRDALRAFLRAYVQGWKFNGAAANRDKAVEVIARYTESDKQAAEVSYNAFFPVWSSAPTPRLDPAGVENVIKLSADAAAATGKASQFLDNSLIDAL